MPGRPSPASSCLIGSTPATHQPPLRALAAGCPTRPRRRRLLLAIASSPPPTPPSHRPGRRARAASVSHTGSSALRHGLTALQTSLFQRQNTYQMKRKIPEEDHLRITSSQSPHTSDRTTRNSLLGATTGVK